MDENNNVIPGSLPEQPPASSEVIPVDASKPPKGFVPLQALHEARTEIDSLREQLRTQTSPSSDEGYSDEGKALKDEFRGEIDSLKQQLAKRDLLDAHPEFKDKWDDLETFRSLPENKGMNLRTAAKAYLIENGLLDTPRKGLEKPTGGTRTPISSAPTADDIKNLRENSPRVYQEMLLKGQIKL